MKSEVRAGGVRTARLIKTRGRLRGGEPFEITVRNICHSGVGFKSSKPLHRGDRIFITLNELGDVSGEVRWTDRLNAGVKFDTQIDPTRFIAAERPQPAHVAIELSYQSASMNLASSARRPGFGIR